MSGSSSVAVIIGRLRQDSINRTIAHALIELAALAQAGHCRDRTASNP